MEGERGKEFEANVRRVWVGPDGGLWGDEWDAASGSDCCYVHVPGDTWVQYAHSAELPVSEERLKAIRSLRE
jgi:hypothetical protein